MNIDFAKGNGLVPVVIQDDNTLQVLMVGYMNEEAYIKTREEKKVTFFSRSKNRLWTKGETSGNYLYVEEVLTDCDNDSLLIKVDPAGPVTNALRIILRVHTQTSFIKKALIKSLRKSGKKLLNW
jgi:phosphoribosyl-ATP pyrophosphohydrolase/phosphoribosyl-AMP cyclohydrolase